MKGGAKPRASQALARVILVAAWLCSLGGWAQDPATEAPDRIHGVVVNSVTGEPIARTLVASPDNRFATLTDSQGNFEFAIQSPQLSSQDPAAAATAALLEASRPTALIPRKPGYLTTPNQNWQIESTTKDVHLSLVPESLIVGHIELPSAEPAARIQVVLFRKTFQGGRRVWAAAGAETTRSDGAFRFAELPAGTYRAWTMEFLDQGPFNHGILPLYGFPAAFYPTASDSSSAESFSLAPGQTFEADFKLTRQPYYPVKVTIANPPLDGNVSASVFTAAGGTTGFSLNYNQQNHVLEGQLPPAAYKIRALGLGEVPTEGEVSLKVNDGAVTARVTLANVPPISVKVKEEFTSAENSTSPSNESAGVDASNKNNLRGPRRYLNLRLETAEDVADTGIGTLRPPANRHDESLVLERVTSGRYWVRVDSSIGYASSITSGGVDLRLEPLVVPMGASVPPIEITMRDDGARIEGSVEGADPALSAGNLQIASLIGMNLPGAHTAYAHVYCIPLADSPGKFTEALVAPDGTFSAPNLPPGTYRVLAFKHLVEFEYANPEALRPYAAEGQVVNLAGGQVERITLSLTPKDAP